MLSAFIGNGCDLKAIFALRRLSRSLGIRMRLVNRLRYVADVPGCLALGFDSIDVDLAVVSCGKFPFRFVQMFYLRFQQ
ncbi:MAG TPA: hypothetical protein VMR80_09225 [Candidatus Acidoferrum sp.]|nr:hypothetical protein [Candidatus Acidoferrum sp.]